MPECFPVNFVEFLRTPFLQNTSGGCFCLSFVFSYPIIMSIIKYSKRSDMLRKAMCRNSHRECSIKSNFLKSLQMYLKKGSDTDVFPENCRNF